MKRVGYLFEQVCSFDNLYRAFRKALRGSGKTEEACRFHFHLENELLALKHEIESGIYQAAPYRYFRIFDPKERTISVAPFRDRVVHHAVVLVLEPVFDPAFIFDSYATRKGKGTHRAVKRAQSFLKSSRYYLKLDVSKYFDSIDHAVLLDLISRRVKDKKLLRLVEAIVRNSDASRGLQTGKGLPIGNLTSQFFANVYLNPLDHFVKEGLRARFYLRYMDDMVVFADCKPVLKEWRSAIEGFLEKQLMLAVNPGSSLLNSRPHGLPFLGFRIFGNLVRLKRENLVRLKKRLRQRIFEYESGAIIVEKLVQSAQSMFEHAAFADSLSLRQKVLAPLADAASG